jgi:long-chain fatty acid transport protein
MSAPANGLAQTSLQIPLQFDFLNPGAKSLAVGGAFSGLADDATATFANPAGLTQLGASEVSVELRGSWVTTQFLQAGRLSGAVTNQGADTIAGAVFADSSGSHGGVGFLAGVYTAPSRRWVVAGFRHELARVDQTFLSNGVFQKDPTSPVSMRELPQEGVRQVSITAYGASASYKVSPTLAVGGGFAAYTFDMNSVFRRFETVGFFGPPNLNAEAGRSTQTGDTVSWAPTLGVLLGRDAFRAGVVFRQGASFDMTTQTPSASGTTLQSKPGKFRVPDTLAFGASYRPRPPLTLALEVTHIWYSQLREDFVTDQAANSGRADSFSVNDGTEIHGGVQYVVPRWRGVPRFRAGVWFDPDHSVHFTPGAGATADDRLFDERLSTALSTGKNQVHGTGGVGLTFGRHVEVNAGIDIASTTRIFSTSLIIR